MFFWRNPVRIQSKPSRDPVGTQSGTAFGQSGSSRDPVGHQFSNFWHHVWTRREAAKITQKRAKTLQKCYFLWIWLPPDIGARLDPDWIHRRGKNPLPHLFFPSQTHPCPYFPFPRTSRAPIPPPSCTKTAKAVLSQTGVLQFMMLR